MNTYERFLAWWNSLEAIELESTGATLRLYRDCLITHDMALTLFLAHEADAVVLDIVKQREQTANLTRL